MLGRLILLLPFCLLFVSSIDAQNRFWVGGSGDWDDVTHWSLTSGGTGGASLPTSSTNAIFDQASFSAAGFIKIPNGASNCKTITFAAIDQQVDVKGGASARLFVHGSFIGDPLLDGSAGSFWELHMVGTGTQSLITSDSELSKIFIEGNGLELTLNGVLDCKSLDIEEGDFDANSESIIVGLGIRLIGNNMITANFSGCDIVCDTWNVSSLSAMVSMTGSSLTVGLLLMGQGVKYVDVTNDATLGFSSISSPSTNTNGHIQNLSFANGADFSLFGDIHIIQDWHLLRGATIDLKANSSYKIDGSIIQPSGCSFTALSGSNDNNPVSIEVSSAQVLDFLELKNITRIGSGSITANNSIDNGNVTGITIGGGSNTTMFWIGGSGDFDDLNHFSMSSGGGSNAQC